MIDAFLSLERQLCCIELILLACGCRFFFLCGDTLLNPSARTAGRQNIFIVMARHYLVSEWYLLVLGQQNASFSAGSVPVFDLLRRISF